MPGGGVHRKRISIFLLVIFAFLLGLSFSFSTISIFPSYASNMGAYNRPAYNPAGGGQSLLGNMLKKYHTTLGEYENKIRGLERENKILKEERNIELGGECKTGVFEELSEGNIKRYTNPRIVGDLAISIVSSGSENPLIALHKYVHEKIKYVDDPRGEEYIATPCETILSGGGDCEDHAILLASLLEAVGIDAKMVWLKGRHIFVGVQTGNEIDEKLKKIPGCEDPIWMDYGGTKLLLSDTTFAPCPGQIEDIYIDKVNGEWRWKNGLDVVVFEV